MGVSWKRPLFPKAVSEKRSATGVAQNGLLCFAKTQANNKTADTLFLQNQPVAASGINNKNFQHGAGGKAPGGSSEEVGRC